MRPLKAIKKALTKSSFEIPAPFEKEKQIWIHIPRTGGSTCSIGVFGYQIGHHDLSDYTRILGTEIKKYFLFSIVRNPFDRYVSAFNFLRNGGITKDDSRFSRSLKLQEHTVNSFATELQRLGPDMYVHFRTQSSFLKSPLKNVMVDQVYKLEEFANGGLDQPTLPLKFREALKRHKINQSRVADRQNLSDQAKPIIVDVYKEDFWRFGYNED
jgi:hypothetical protein